MINNIQFAAFADEAGSMLDDQITALKENNIGYLEIRGVDGKNIAGLTLNEVKEIAKKLSGNGIKTWSIGSPTGKIKITDDFSPHLDSFKRMIESANILGASCYRLFSFFATQESNAYRDEVLYRLSRFCEAAKGSGVLICHENEKEIYGESDDNCLDIHRSLPEIKAIFDPANFIQSGVDTLNAWNKLAPYVEYVHIKDALPDGSVVPAGFGAGNIKEIITKYFEQGGRLLTVEPHLSVFEGLAALEGENRSIVGKGEFQYESQRSAFDAAVKALNDIIESIQKESEVS